jgi:hypothetical protein
MVDRGMEDATQPQYVRAVKHRDGRNFGISACVASENDRSFSVIGTYPRAHAAHAVSQFYGSNPKGQAPTLGRVLSVQTADVTMLGRGQAVDGSPRALRQQLPDCQFSSRLDLRPLSARSGHSAYSLDLVISRCLSTNAARQRAQRLSVDYSTGHLTGAITLPHRHSQFEVKPDVQLPAG